jgi:hypothetical protein
MKRKRLKVEYPIRYPVLFKGIKVDPRLVEAMLEIVEAMPPAFRFGCYSQYVDDVLRYGPRLNPVVDTKDFTLNMLKEGDILGRVSWYFSERSTPNPKDAPTILMEITPQGISIDSRLATWGRSIFVLKDLLPLYKMPPTSTNDPSKFQLHIATNEEALVKEALSFLK